MQHSFFDVKNSPNNNNQAKRSTSLSKSAIQPYDGARKQSDDQIKFLDSKIYHHKTIKKNTLFESKLQAIITPEKKLVYQRDFIQRQKTNPNDTDFTKVNQMYREQYIGDQDLSVKQRGNHFQKLKLPKQKEQKKKTPKKTKKNASQYDFYSYFKIISLFCLILFIFLITLEVKSRIQFENRKLQQQVKECYEAYYENECYSEWRAPILEEFCKEKEFCMNSQSDGFGQYASQVISIFSNFMNEFFTGLSWKAFSFILLLIPLVIWIQKK